MCCNRRRGVIVKSNQISKPGNLEADIVVIGGGGTGLAAAVVAAEKGAKVILLEKKGAPGGTSVFASGLLAAESPVQKRMGIAVLKDDVFKIAMDYSHWKINPRLFRSFVDKSADTIQWLEKKGLRFNWLPAYYPGRDMRTLHSLEEFKKAGLPIVKTLRKNCEDLGVRLFFHCPAKRILTDEKGDVSGVLAAMKGDEFKITTKSVIIATGGYGGNKELLKRYCSSYSESMQFLGVPHTGDGLLMAIETGAATEGLGTLLVLSQFYRGSAYVNDFAQEPFPIWVNKNGERFTDETITFHAGESGNIIARQPDKCMYVLFDEKLKNRVLEEGFLRGQLLDADKKTGTVRGAKPSELEHDLQSEAAKGGVKISDSWDKISDWIGAAPAILKFTINEYNHFCDRGYDENFTKDRRYLQALRTPPYYAIRCFLSCLDTIGGIKINHHMEVLNTQDNPIPGLYAGGDAAGGWESDTYCLLLPGSAFGFAINSGCIAGENAVEYVSRK